MAANFKQKNSDGQIQPFLNLGPAFDLVASLPAAANYEGRMVLLGASTVPGGACLAISDGTSWFPVLIGTTAIS